MKSNISTEAWVLYAGKSSKIAEKGELILENFSFPNISETEVLAEPIYGCWEGNMTHAISRSPVDICKARGEEKVVLGNAGVVRVLRVGDRVQSLKTGDIAIVFCNGVSDRYGYPEKIFGYDAPNTIGVLAKQTKFSEKQLIKIPDKSRFSLEQWAAFSLRYPTAWANWKLAYGCWRLQVTEEDAAVPHVWGWGGGVSLAELTLAKAIGSKTAMLTSDVKRFSMISNLGIEAIDRRAFGELAFDPEKYRSDIEYRKKYDHEESLFLNTVKQKTDGHGVSIFIDHVGGPVIRATQKALARQGVITTSGWKEGMKTTSMRAIECIARHIHVHTHYARYSQGVAAVHYAENTGWIPTVESKSCSWNDIPDLAAEYAGGKMPAYFPIFEVNKVSSQSLTEPSNQESGSYQQPIKRVG